MSFLKTEPALIGGVVEAAVLVGSVFVFHWSPDQIAAATGLALAITKLFIRQSVIPATTVADKAVEVGTQVATQLSTTTVGKVGTMTGQAEGLVHSVVQDVIGTGGI